MYINFLDLFLLILFLSIIFLAWRHENKDRENGESIEYK